MLGWISFPALLVLSASLKHLLVYLKKFYSAISVLLFYNRYFVYGLPMKSCHTFFIFTRKLKWVYKLFPFTHLPNKIIYR